MAQKMKHDEEKPSAKEEILPALESSNLPAGVDADLAREMADNVDHQEVFDSDQLTVPRLALLQDLSPETKERNGAYVPGARPGLILNKLKRAVDDKVRFVPAKFMVRYIAWRPRADGGGLVDQGLTRQECEDNFESDGIGRWIGMIKPRAGAEAVKVEIIQTAEWVGFAKSVSYDWTPVAISFPGTKAKVVRDINTTIDVARMEFDGKRFKPAPFFHEFEIGSFLDRSGEDEFFNFTADWSGWCQDKSVRDEAKALKESFERGEADVESSGSNI